MSKKNKSELPTSWSEKMLEGFIDYCLTPLGPTPGQISFFIMEKQTHIDFSLNESKDESISYIGLLSQKKLENVYFSLSSVWPTSKEQKGCMGYLKLLNGRAYDSYTPVPMIRGFIRRGLGFFETINNLLRDAKIFGWKYPIGLNIQIIIPKHINTGNILSTKLGIKEVRFYQKLSVFDRNDFLKHL